MNRGMAVGIVGFLAILFGCGPKHDLAGTWSASNLPGTPSGSVAQITYAEPDKLAMNLSVSQDGGGVKFTMVMSVTGTYKVSGNRITHKAGAIDFKVNGLDGPTTQRVMEALEPKRQGLLDQLNQEPDQTFEWKSKDEIVFKTKRGDTILKRKS